MNIGDIVKLKSGGPLMTVDNIISQKSFWVLGSIDKERISCIWFTQIKRTFSDEDDGETIRTMCEEDVQSHWFRPEVLEKVSP